MARNGTGRRMKLLQPLVQARWSSRTMKRRVELESSPRRPVSTPSHPSRRRKRRLRQTNPLPNLRLLPQRQPLHHPNRSPWYPRQLLLRPRLQRQSRLPLKKSLQSLTTNTRTSRRYPDRRTFRYRPSRSPQNVERKGNTKAQQTENLLGPA